MAFAQGHPFHWALFAENLSAAATTKPLDKASVSVGKIESDGKITAVTSATAATDDQGKYTFSNVPEGANLVVMGTKNVKDDTGKEKIITLENVITVSTADVGKVKEGVDLKADTTLAVENVKDMIVSANSGKADADKIDGSKLANNKVDEIKTVYANYNAGGKAASTAFTITVAAPPNKPPTAFRIGSPVIGNRATYRFVYRGLHRPGRKIGNVFVKLRR